VDESDPSNQKPGGCPIIYNSWEPVAVLPLSFIQHELLAIELPQGTPRVIMTENLIPVCDKTWPEAAAVFVGRKTLHCVT
jgi:hypothetical protein